MSLRENRRLRTQFFGHYFFPGIGASKIGPLGFPRILWLRGLINPDSEHLPFEFLPNLRAGLFPGAFRQLRGVPFPCGGGKEVWHFGPLFRNPFPPSGGKGTKFLLLSGALWPSTPQAPSSQKGRRETPVS